MVAFICSALMLASVMLANPTVNVVIDGVRQQFDVPPQIIDDFIMLPLREVAQVLGLGVEFEVETNTAVLTMGDMRVTHEIGTIGAMAEFGHGGADWFFRFDTVSQVVDDRVLVPLRGIAEITGASVEWDAETKTAIIDTYGMQRFLSPPAQQHGHHNNRSMWENPMYQLHQEIIAEFGPQEHVGVWPDIENIYGAEFARNYANSMRLMAITPRFTQNINYFGGMYINDDGILTVLIVEGYPGLAGLETLVREGAIVREVEYSEQELNSMMDILTNAWMRMPNIHEPGGMPIVSALSVDIRNNRVVVHFIVEECEESTAFFRAVTMDSPMVQLAFFEPPPPMIAPPLTVNPALEDVQMELVSVDNECVTVRVVNYSPHRIVPNGHWDTALELFNSETNTWYTINRRPIGSVFGGFIDIAPGGASNTFHTFFSEYLVEEPGLYRKRMFFYISDTLPLPPNRLRHEMVVEFYV